MERFKSIVKAPVSDAQGSGRYLAGSVSRRSKKIPCFVILAFILRSALQLTPQAHGAGCAVPWKTDNPSVQTKVFSAELGADTRFL